MIDPSLLLLLVVVGALAAAPALLRRHRGAAPEGVRVVGRTALHKNAVVAVLAVGDRRLLVGAGERGVQLLTELAPAAGEDDGLTDALTSFGATSTASTMSTASYDLTSVGRMDAGDPTSPPTSAEGALDALAGLDLGVGTTTAGPRIGLVDRLRGMTVRTPVPGRPIRVPLRR